MNFKRLLLISIIAIAVICSLNVVSADLFGGSTAVDFGGASFNIPEGYQEINPDDVDFSYTDYNLNNGQNMEYKVFKNTSSKYVVLSVVTAPYRLTLEDAKQIYSSSKGPFTEKTINGHSGLISSNGKTFLYVVDGNIICVHPWQESLEDIIV